ncbi:tyrosine-type recombinase/integrase [Virgibacillus sp. CBA3643]|uniref:tyrosine-type recombinase/integrase n=1 Tax=Virgibacillus sp. CBA3643 TaxID=2942278 RepID=UPI0035A3CAC3
MENVISFPKQENLIDEYERIISHKSGKTVDAYLRSIRQFASWLSERPGGGDTFHPEQMTTTALDVYLEELEAEYSINYRNRIKSAISGFSNWLIEKGLLQQNPARGVEIPPQPLLAPRELSQDQRYVLRNLVEKKEKSLRGKALFALGYWAGCRVSDVSWLKMKDVHVGKKVGWLHVGHKNKKGRDIDILNQVRRPIHDFLEDEKQKKDRPYVFFSQRSDRLTEAGIHHWFRNLKRKATKDEWEYIQDITFHDLRHDFAHRAREAGWTIEEIAYYLGHVTKKGTPAIETTARYTQVSRKQIKGKLQLVKG